MSNKSNKNNNIEVKKDTIGQIIWCDNCTEEARKCGNKCSVKSKNHKK